MLMFGHALHGCSLCYVDGNEELVLLMFLLSFDAFVADIYSTAALRPRFC